MHYLLRYTYVADVAERRAPFRAAHLQALWDEADAGRVLLAGGAGDPMSEGVIVFDVDDPAVVHEFVRTDPYRDAGLILDYTVTPWHTVVGDLSDNPTRP